MRDLNESEKNKLACKIIMPWAKAMKDGSFNNCDSWELICKIIAQIMRSLVNEQGERATRDAREAVMNIMCLDIKHIAESDLGQCV